MYVSAGNFAFSNIKRAYHSQFNKVNFPQSPHFRRIQKKTLQTSVFLIKMADEEGFEPPIRVTPYKRFRVARIQPLCHSSFVLKFLIIFYSSPCRCELLRAAAHLYCYLNSDAAILTPAICSKQPSNRIFIFSLQVLFCLSE